MTSAVVYTALFGGYERLRPQPSASGSNATFYCFTDEPDLASDDWTIVEVDPLFRHDPVRSARALKTVGHSLLETAESTLWIDNRVELTAPPESLLDDWLTGVDLAIPEHSFRDTLLDEFTAVADAGLDDTNRVWEHLLHTSESAPDLLDRRPLWTGMVARRQNAATQRFGRRWQDLLNRYSRRDQLSVIEAITETGVDLRTVSIDNRVSEWHRWPEVDAALRRRPAYHERWQNAMRPPALTAAALRDRNLRLERRVQELEDDLAARRADLDDARSALQQARETASFEVAAARATAEEAAALLETERSALIEARTRVAGLEDEVASRRRGNDRLRDDASRLSRELDGIKASGSYRLARQVARIVRFGRR